MSVNVYICPDGDTTTTPPDISRPELWIAVSLLLFIMTISVCGLVLFLRFRRAHCRLKNAEDHDVTVRKVPSGDDPTYGVSDLICFSDMILLKDLQVFEFPHILNISVSFHRKSMMSFVRQGVGQGCPIWSRGLWPDKSHLWNVSVSLLPHHCCFLTLFCVLLYSCILCPSVFRKRQVWGGVEGNLDGGKCGCQDLLLQGRAVLVQRDRDLQYSTAATRQYTGYGSRLMFRGNVHVMKRKVQTDKRY